LIIRLRSLGDCVLTTPAIHLLKNHRPDLRIAVMVEDRFADVFRGNPDVNAVLPAHPVAAAIWNPTLTINLHGGTGSMWMTVASTARFRAGFAHFRGQALYNRRIPRAQEILGEERTVHTAEHMASAMFWLGVPSSDIPRARLFTPSAPAEHPIAVFHPFASTEAKTWPAERFLAVASQLRNLEPVFIGSPFDDLTPFRQYRTVANTHLRETIALIRSASLFAGNDSGPAHIAAACNIPLAVLFADSDPVIWAPWRADAAQTLIAPSIEDIRVEQVIEAIAALGVAA
jgi:ADP-heptose:LPS heptosyltransferase